MNNPLAASPFNSKGRLFDENEELSSSRTPYERDRDRIIHSNSFRKLKHKTQVFIESDSDYYRTRLTHSLEVAQISRSLCRALKLDEDLGEVVSLAHDLGHPPFGHNGERALNLCMESYGGFNHNDQTLRVITKIEKRHPNFEGLNLTWESLEGIVKHNGIILKNIPFHINSYNNIHNLLLNTNPHLESQIAAISDDVAYNNHDVEDAIRAGLINNNSLKELNYFNQIIKKLYDRFPNIENNILTYQILRTSISEMINDIINNSLNMINKFNIKTINDIKSHNFFLISMSDNIKKECLDIRSFLYENVYNHPKLLKKRSNSENIIFKIFEYYKKNFEKLPKDWLLKGELEIQERIICDYISGMTDRYASKLYKSIYE
jgi:dGTPase